MPMDSATHLAMARCLLLFVGMVLLAGCGGRSAETPPAGAQKLVRVDWFGYESFKIRTSLGLTILTNPFSPGTVDISPPKNLEADVVLISDEDTKRNYVDGVQNTPRLFRGSVAMGTNSAAGVRILGVPIYPNPEQPNPSDMSVMYRWTVDGLKFAFIGNVKSVPTTQELRQLGKVDVLFIPVSGSVLTTANRLDILKELSPSVVIPMGNQSAVARFGAGFASVYPLNGPAALLSREAMPAQQTALIFRAP
jgi:hypothetical protein